jgi:hypothetical protein
MPEFYQLFTVLEIQKRGCPSWTAPFFGATVFPESRSVIIPLVFYKPFFGLPKRATVFHVNRA